MRLLSCANIDEPSPSRRRLAPGVLGDDELAVEGEPALLDLVEDHLDGHGLGHAGRSHRARRPPSRTGRCRYPRRPGWPGPRASGRIGAQAERSPNDQGERRATSAEQAARREEPDNTEESLPRIRCAERGMCGLASGNQCSLPIQRLTQSASVPGPPPPRTGAGSARSPGSNRRVRRGEGRPWRDGPAPLGADRAPATGDRRRSARRLRDGDGTARSRRQGRDDGAKRRRALAAAGSGARGRDRDDAREAGRDGAAATASRAGVGSGSLRLGDRCRASTRRPGRRPAAIQRPRSRLRSGAGRPPSRKVASSFRSSLPWTEARPT